MSELQIVVFLLNRDVYGADSDQVKQIIQYEDITPVLGMPDYMDGTVTLRGNDIPVINFNTRFGYGETKVTERTKILVTEIDSSLIGFVVNDVRELYKAQPEDMEALSGLIRKSGNAYIYRAVKKADEIIPIIDLQKVLTASELNTMTAKSAV